MEDKTYSGGFEDLEVWKEARKYRITISELVKTFPREEKYKLVDQLIRSARSISANIAEGYGRYHYQENIQSCRQARGSLMETLDHLICANDEKYLDDELLNKLRVHYALVLKILNGYILYLKNRKNE